MAGFVETLPNANSSQRIIDPGKSGPSWFEGLADIASKGVETFSNLVEQGDRDSRQRAADARQASEDERKRRQEQGADRLAGILWEARDRQAEPGAPAPLADNANDYPVYTPIDGSLEGIPVDERVAEVVGPRVDELRRAQASEDQGRAPQGSFRVMLERNISALMAEMPDQRAEIFNQLKEAGFNHYLFREAEADQRFHEANVTQEISQRNAYADVAISNGLVPVGTDPNVAAEVGQRQAFAESQAKAAQQLAEAARAGNAEARAQLEFNRQQADDETRRNFAGNLSAVLQPRWAQLANLMTQGNGSAEAMNLLPDALRNMDVLVENHIAAARQNNVSEETINSMRADWDNMKKSAIGFVTGPESDVGVARVALQGIQTRLGLNLAEALPTYMALQEVFGATALSTMFGPEGNISQEMINQARQEMRGISGAIDTDAERVSMATTAQILRGQLSINQMTEDQARRQMPVLVSSINGLAADVARGSGNPQSLVNGNLQVVRAAMELQPGAPAVTQEIVAVNTLFHGQQRQALERIRRDDPAQGELMTRAARSAATHLWGNLRGHRLSSSESQNGLWGIRYDTATGQFSPQLNQTRYNEILSQMDPRARSQLTPLDAMRTRPPRALVNLVSAQNRVVTFLTETSQYDPQFQGVDNTSARDFYVNNRIPAAMRRRQETEGAASATFEQQSQAFRQGLDADRAASEQVRANAVSGRLAAEDYQSAPPQGAVQEHVRRAAEAVGVEWSVIDRLVRKESGWRVDPGENGSMQGLFQVKGGSTDWQENTRQGLDHWLAAGNTARRALGRDPTPADQYVAYQQGVGGGGALLNPANADQPAWEVLVPFYRREYGERAEQVAKRAVTGNRGTLNMTAAQFAQHIRDYFNR